MAKFVPYPNLSKETLKLENDCLEAGEEFRFDNDQATAYEIVQVAKNSYYVKIEYGNAIPTQCGSFSSVKKAKKWIEKHSKESALYPKVIERYDL